MKLSVVFFIIYCEDFDFPGARNSYRISIEGAGEGMDRYCPICGNIIDPVTNVCGYCGTSDMRIQQDGQYYTGDPYQGMVQSGDPYQNRGYAGDPYDQSVFAGYGQVRTGIPAPGFSDRAEHPEVLAAVKKNRNAGKIFGVIIVPLPLIGFLIYSMLSDKMEVSRGFLYGGIVSLVFLVFAISGFVRERSSKTYDADVIDKKMRTIYRNRNSDDPRPITEYTTVVRTLDGRKKKIVELEGSRIWAYSYLNEGDRFRYHPHFSFPYELYDKTHADGIYCVSCQTKNTITEDRCRKCNVPLLK